MTWSLKCGRMTRGPGPFIKPTMAHPCLAHTTLGHPGFVSNIVVNLSSMDGGSQECQGWNGRDVMVHDGMQRTSLDAISRGPCTSEPHSTTRVFWRSSGPWYGTHQTLISFHPHPLQPGAGLHLSLVSALWGEGHWRYEMVKKISHPLTESFDSSLQAHISLIDRRFRSYFQRKERQVR